MAGDGWYVRDPVTGRWSDRFDTNAEATEHAIGLEMGPLSVAMNVYSADQKATLDTARRIRAAGEIAERDRTGGPGRRRLEVV